MYVIPAPGLSIRDPDRRDRLPIGGREVPDTPYWRRRIGERSVFAGEIPAEAPAEPVQSEEPAPEPKPAKTGPRYQAAGAVAGA